MEKITYLPLISHLQERADFYNGLYRESQLRYGDIPKEVLNSWLVHTVAPVVEAATQGGTDPLPTLFKALYTELLGLLGSQLAVIYEHQYQAAWGLLAKAPRLATIWPSRLLKALNSALVVIRTHQPDQVLPWLALMDQVAPHCSSIEEFLICGRVNAWLCGLAHLKAKALETFALLPLPLQERLQADTPVSIRNTVGESPWIGTPGSQHPAFMGEVGGFAGFGGPFLVPPLVALIRNHVVATDKKTTCLLFADRFGKVLLSDFSVTPQEIIKQATNKELAGFKAKYGLPFDDISSSVLKDYTLVVTRHSSHYLFIYGWTG